MPLLWNQNAIPKSYTATFQWGGVEAPYADIVYFGRDGGAGISIARPWVEPVLERVNLESSFAASYFENNGNFKEAFKQVVSDLKDEFNDVIDNFDWSVVGENLKQFRDEPTWQTITDSGALRDSLEVSISD